MNSWVLNLLVIEVSIRPSKIMLFMLPNESIVENKIIIASERILRPTEGTQQDIEHRYAIFW
ncbi:hypothetical protein D3C87_2142360 [compost metagenome]